MHVMGSVSPANEREVFQKEGVAVSVPMLQPRSPSPSRFGFLENTQMRSSTPPPLPPPPPPPPLPLPLLPLPPPPPPPPPLFSGLGDPTDGLRRKKRVRSFFWKTIPEDQVKGRANLWTQRRVQQQYQIDVQTIEELFGQKDCQSNAGTPPTRGGKARSSFRETKQEVKGRANLWTQRRVQQQYQIDVQTIEELFGQKDCQSNAGTPPTRGGKARSSFRETKQEVSILDSKRGMNIGIFLKQFKRSEVRFPEETEGQDQVVPEEGRGDGVMALLAIIPGCCG
ncbi:hypothetical protein LDENG_00267630 [Lucifuga dentata]|nr:hypothetical protein LDENG_00267630 [Lucifuga dentata]